MGQKFLSDIKIQGKRQKHTIASDPCDISTWQISEKELSVGSQEANAEAIFFKPDGTKMYIAGRSGDDVNEYALSTAWDITTASFTDTLDGLESSPASESNPYGMYISPNGIYFYLVGHSTDQVIQYTMSTAWDISTASYTREQALTIANGNSFADPIGINFKSDGTMFWVVSQNSDAIQQYTLSTAWDVSTLSVGHFKSLTGGFFTLHPLDENENNYNLGSIEDIWVSEDGTKVWMPDSSYDTVHQLKLSTAFDVTTATYDGCTIRTSAYQGDFGGLYVNETVGKAFTVAPSGDWVRYWDFGGIVFDNDSEGGIGFKKGVSIKGDLVNNGLFNQQGRASLYAADFHSTLTAYGTVSLTHSNGGTVNILDNTTYSGVGLVDMLTNVRWGRNSGDQNPYTNGLVHNINFGAPREGSIINLNIGRRQNGNTVTRDNTGIMNIVSKAQTFTHDGYLTIGQKLQVTGNADLQAFDLGGTVIFSDTFTETNTTALESHTPDTGAGWTKVLDTGSTSTWNVIGGTGVAQVDASVSSAGMIYLCDTLPTAVDYEIKVDFLRRDSSDDTFYIIFKYKDADNFFFLSWSASYGTYCKLRKKEGGSFSDIATFDYGVFNSTADNTATSLKVRFIDNKIMVWDIDQNGYQAYRGSFDVTDFTNDGSGGTFHKFGMGIGGIDVSGYDQTNVWKVDKFEVKQLSSAATLKTSTKHYIESGDVGIGTSSPTAKLHLYDSECNIKLESSHGRLSTINQGGGHLHVNANHANGVALNYGNTTNKGLLALYDNETAAITLQASDGSGTFSGDLKIASLKKLYFDGGGDTFITENAANNLQFKVGGNQKLVLGNSGATIDSHLKWGDNYQIQLGSDADLQWLHTGTHMYMDNSTGDMNFRQKKENADIIFQGNDNNGTSGVNITALSLDMSDAGAAYFNSWIYTSGGGIGRDAHNTIDFSTDNQITFKTDNTTALTINSTGNATFASTITLPNSNTLTGSSGKVAFSGRVSGSTPTGTTDFTTKAYVDQQISNLSDSAPDTLNTLNELAAALGDDANFSTTVTNSIATKLPLAGGTMSGDIAMGNNDITGVKYIQYNGDVDIRTSTGEYSIYGAADGQTALYTNGVKKFETTTVGIDVTGKVQADSLDIDGDGDIAGNLQVTKNAATLNLVGTDHSYIQWYPDGISDGRKAYTGFGGATDNNFSIVNEISGANVKIDTNGGTIQLQDNTVVSGELEATSLDINGNADISGNLDVHGHLSLQDNDKLYIGAGNDLEIYHSGSNSYIKDTGSGNLIVDTNGFYLKNAADNEFMITAVENSAVNLYYDNSAKLATKSDGVDITGELQCDTLDVDGNADISGELTINKLDHYKFTTSTNDSLSFTYSSRNMAMPVNSYLWHDLLGFDYNYTRTQEISTDGTNFSSHTLDKSLFSQKQDQSVTVIDTNEQAVRWTFQGVAWSLPDWINLAFTYVSSDISKDVLVESSTDGSSWTTRHTSTVSAGTATKTLFISSFGGDSYLRLTITKNPTSSTNVVRLSSIRLMTARAGDQGQGMEHQFPYTWDYDRRIAIGHNPTTSTYEASLAIKGLTADTTANSLVIRNSSNSSLLSVRNDGRVDIPAGNLVVTNDLDINGTADIAGALTTHSTVTIGATQKLYLDGGSNTYITESSADVISFYRGGSHMAYIDSAGVFSMGNLYTGNTGQFRNYGGTWKASTGLTGNGFEFLNSVDGTAMTLSSTGSATFAGGVVVNGGALQVNNAGVDKKMSFDRTGGKGISIEHDASSIYFYNETDSAPIFKMFNGGDVRAYGEVEATSLDINGNADISGNITVGGTVDGVDIAAFKTAFDNQTDNNTFRTIEVDSNGNDSADSTLTATEALRFKKGSNVSIDEADGVITISSTDTNTTYSVGDGGLTQKNFTTTLKNKLDGITASADVTPSWVPSSDPSYLTGITSSQVTTALGFTPMNATTTTISSAQATKLSNITVTSGVDLDEVSSNAEGAVQASTTSTISGTKTFSAATGFTNTTNSTSKTTGAIKLSGGMGIAKTLNVGEDVVAYASSDERYKDNLQAITNPIDKVKSLTGYTFTWNDKHEQFNGNNDIGVVAQEVEKILPEIVDTRDNGYKAVKYEKMVALLIEAVKDQQEQIDELKQRLDGCSC